MILDNGMTEMADFLIDDAAVHFAASKNLGYRDRVRRRFKIFVEFLQRHGLTTRTLLPDGVDPDATFKIMRSDLTDDGYAVVHMAYHKWLRALDRGTEIENMACFEKALFEIRSR